MIIVEKNEGPKIDYEIQNTATKKKITFDDTDSTSNVYGWVDKGDIAGQATPTPEPWTPKVGDVVIYNGVTHYTNANAANPKRCKGGKAVISRIYKLGQSKHPYLLIRVAGSGATVYGWVDAGTFTKA